MTQLKPSAQRVQEALFVKGYTNTVVELPDSTRTAAEAAQAIGCNVAQIAKSLVFRRTTTGSALMVVASGVNRVNEQLIAEAMGEPLGKADADFVKAQTGFVIGGVPPIGHTRVIETWIDADLLQYREIWAAAGHPMAVFRLTPEELIQMTNGRVGKIKK